MRAVFMRSPRMGWAVLSQIVRGQTERFVTGSRSVQPRRAFPAWPRAGRGEQRLAARARPQVGDGDQFIACEDQRAARTRPWRHARLLEQVAQFAGVRVARGLDALAAGTKTDDE